MIAYWLLFIYFAAGAIFTSPSREAGELRPGVLYTVGALFMCALIGFRYQVGGDWIQYLWFFRHDGQKSFWEAIQLSDPGYQAISWITYRLGTDVWSLNLVCASIFTWGLFKFCRTQPDPWLATLIAVPYMVIVIAMGYTRQAVALGILMAGIAAFLRGASAIKFGFYVLVAALFHKTAVIAFPVIAITADRNRFVNVLLIAAVALVSYDALVGDTMDTMMKNYFGLKYSSQGAWIRILMNVVASSMLFTFRSKMQFDNIEWRLWRNFAIASIISLLALLFSSSSAAIDRISLYLLPLQLATLSRFPRVCKSRTVGILSIIIYCFAVQFVWLNFAQNSWAWLPYRVFPLMGPLGPQGRYIH